MAYFTYPELAQNFKHVVDMSSAVPFKKGESVATYGLGGCVAGYIETPHECLFFHYHFNDHEQIYELLKKHLDAVKIQFVIPQNEYGQFGRFYKDKLWHSLDILRKNNISFDVALYQAERTHNSDPSHGMAWLTEEGELFIAGHPAQQDSFHSPLVA